MKETVHQRPPGPEAVIEYHTPEFKVIRPGAYVTCAVTGRPIPLDQLRYWSVEHQEAYVDAAAANQRQAQARAQAEGKS